MALSIFKRRLKKGMGGSNCGKGRSEPTEIMKQDGKKARRIEDKKVTASEYWDEKFYNEFVKKGQES